MTYIVLTLALTPLFFVLGFFLYLDVAADTKSGNLAYMPFWPRCRAVLGLALAIGAPVAYLAAVSTWAWGMFYSLPWAACL